MNKFLNFIVGTVAHFAPPAVANEVEGVEAVMENALEDVGKIASLEPGATTTTTPFVVAEFGNKYSIAVSITREAA